MKRREFIVGVGGMVAWSTIPSTLAQQLRKVDHIAIVHPGLPVSMLTESSDNPYQRAFFAELRRLGYVEGRNLIIDRYSGEGLSTARLVELARTVVREAPNLIVASSYYVVQPLKEATTTIPIVGIVNDPIATGLAASLSHPGGNLTGVVTDAGLELWEKRFELLREMVPAALTVAFLVSTTGWDHPYGLAVRQAAERTGIRLKLAGVPPPFQETEIRQAFADLRQERVDALVVNEGPRTLAQRQAIVQLVRELQLPTMYPFRDFVEAGGLMAYAVDVSSQWSNAAKQVDQILKGAKPGELPFVQAERFELVINLKTAKELHLTVSPSLRARADEVVE
jgi:ABC-type uncharacterized transport system substrate-binding protein